MIINLQNKSLFEKYISGEDRWGFEKWYDFWERCFYYPDQVSPEEYEWGIYQHNWGTWGTFNDEEYDPLYLGY